MKKKRNTIENWLKDLCGSLIALSKKEKVQFYYDNIFKSFQPRHIYRFIDLISLTFSLFLSLKEKKDRDIQYIQQT